jgi:predicted nucleic acid-binding protein
MPNGSTISNSSCLIALHAIGNLDILQQLYGTIEVPDAVVQEFGPGLPVWVRARPVQNQAVVRSLRLQLGAGEAEAIALAMELSAARLILDDKQARALACQLTLPVTGTLAVLLRAKECGVLPQVRGVLDALLAAGFRASDALIQEILKLAGE